MSDVSEEDNAPGEQIAQAMNEIAAVAILSKGDLSKTAKKSTIGRAIYSDS
ncbi:hypothetical protein [Bacillus thermotolerans]|uniref:Uncharacterized protein n=1 Tax=Bacillus thermotolerans TaxID=1221996 RepID=A0A0F5I1F2_BACTR|nr:hypothetical protein [Bacillus thermotolerans]KKB37450.1 hypothetical protein QY97_00305 [Bacillus thermotolerans]KKB39504.1 hypothetical protein QY95_02352 [Bacillus thermotolerans]